MVALAMGQWQGLGLVFGVNETLFAEPTEHKLHQLLEKKKHN